MQLSNLIVLFAGIAAAVPTPEEVGPSGHEVEIKGFTYAGSGCKANTVGHMLSTDRTTLTLIYGEDFTVQSGKDIQPKERRRNCQLNVKLHYPQGWQFSVLKADYRGYANIPKGSSGTCSATYYFSGSSQQITRKMKLAGPIDKDYIKTDELGVESTVWSPCGAEGMLNINNAITLTPLKSDDPALMTAESTDLKFKQICHLQWRRCHKK